MRALRFLQHLAIAAALLFPVIHIYGEIERYALLLGFANLGYLAQFHPLQMGQIHLPTVILLLSLPAAWIAAGELLRPFERAIGGIVARYDAAMAFLADSGQGEEE